MFLSTDRRSPGSSVNGDENVIRVVRRGASVGARTDFGGDGRGDRSSGG